MKQLHRQIPFHQRKNVEKCLKELLDLDIIEPAVGPTPWINPVVLVPKKQGGVRLCIDIFIYLFIWGFTSLSTLYRSYHDG